MTEEFDPKKSYLVHKFHEGMLAFTGFSMQLSTKDAAMEGLLKIASTERAYRGDSLTLTFLVDTAGDSNLRDDLSERFRQLSRHAFGSFLGEDFDDVSHTPLDEISDLKDWLVQEIRISFRTFKGNFKTIVEQDLLPGLEKLLNANFQPVEWWPQEEGKAPDSSSPEWSSSSGLASFKDFFGKWFGRD